MKRLFLYFMTMMSMFATSCVLFSDDESSDYSNVYNGIVMYSCVEATNNIAMDGVNVAMRLALLLNEMEAAGMEFDSSGEEPDWSLIGNFTYSGLSYNKKIFLFGNSSNVSISKDSDKFYITYGSNESHTAGAYDTSYRKGTYCVETSGATDIMDSSESQKWSISISSDTMSFSSVKNDVNALYDSTSINAELWCSDNSEFTYSINNAAILFHDDDEDEEDWEYCDWSTKGTVSIPYYTAFTIEDTINTDFYMNVESASGTAVTLDPYQYSTLSPVIYNFLSGANLKYGGSENVDLMKSSVDIVSKTVLVETASNGLQTFYYNGYSYEYDDEFYYIYYIDSFRDTEADAEDDYLDYLEDLEDED